MSQSIYDSGVSDLTELSVLSGVCIMQFWIETKKLLIIRRQNEAKIPTINHPDHYLVGAFMSLMLIMLERLERDRRKSWNVCQDRWKSINYALTLWQNFNFIVKILTIESYPINGRLMNKPIVSIFFCVANFILSIDYEQFFDNKICVIFVR